MAFPTETVYGLGARLSDPEAIRKVYRVKGRPSDNPLIVHVSGPEAFRRLTKRAPPEAFRLIRRFWPGPLTLVCRRSKLVPKTVTAGLETVAVRMPSHPVALKLLKAVGDPVAAPSANRSGRPSPTNARDVARELSGRVDLIIAGGHSRVGLESTVLDVTRKPFRILRPGAVTLEDLRKVVPEVESASARAPRGAAASPGLKHRHYRPSCSVVLVQPDQWDENLRRWARKGLKLGALSLRRRIPKRGVVVFSRSFGGDTGRFARSLYSSFFRAEQAGVEALLVESIEKRGVGAALMDRLSRAAAG